MLRVAGNVSPVGVRAPPAAPAPSGQKETVAATRSTLCNTRGKSCACACCAHVSSRARATCAVVCPEECGGARSSPDSDVPPY